MKDLKWRSSSEDQKKKKACVGWVEKYFKDCVSDVKTEISFGLGFVSFVAWGVAEIPQIITNFRTKSAHGVSLGLLLTWFFGDIFNLVGCMLEPVTLPTQFYTALLYTCTTLVLLVQTIYYDYWLRWRKSRGFQDAVGQEEESRDCEGPNSGDKTKPIPATSFLRSSPRIDIYYTSARSLASSGTPQYGSSSSSYLVVPRSDPSALRHRESSSDEEATSPTHRRTRRTRSKPKPIVSRSVGHGTLIASSVGMPFQAKALRILQETRMEEGNPYGLMLGWIMAAIYMGGRLPQIYLNIKRGSVEGLNPLMFMFALIANITYVGSILVRSTEWERIKANSPWLLDAMVCVLLDLFIMIQFAYYKYKHRRNASNEEDNESYAEVKKPLL